jgi:hypothetical protein
MGAIERIATDAARATGRIHTEVFVPNLDRIVDPRVVLHRKGVVS